MITHDVTEPYHCHHCHAGMCPVGMTRQGEILTQAEIHLLFSQGLQTAHDRAVKFSSLTHALLKEVNRFNLV